MGRRATIVAAVALLAAGCGGERASRPHAAGSASPVERCIRSGPDTRIVRVADLGGSVVVIGSGSRGAVMANQTGGNLCEWLPLARGLARAGMRALLFDLPRHAGGGRQLVLLPGSEHGTDLLKGRDAARVIRTIARVARGSSERH